MNVLTEWTSFHSVEVVGVDTDDVRLRRRTKGKVAQKLFVVLFAVLDVAPRLRAGVGIDADHEDVHKLATTPQLGPVCARAIGSREEVDRLALI